MIWPPVALCLGLSLVARADDFWKHKPAAQWSSAEALKLVRHNLQGAGFAVHSKFALEPEFWR
jgi:hypothetical protein